MSSAIKLRPSDAARWTRCPGALRFTQSYPNDSSAAADEGTMCHSVREMCLRFGFDAYDFVGRKFPINGHEWTFDEDLAEAIQPGIDEIGEYQGRLIIEQWVDTTQWVGLDENGNPQGGTIDCGVIGKHLYFQSDLKAGKGVAVQAVGNDQQVLYALAAYETFIKHEAPECRQFLLAIDQPRNAAGGGYWHLSLDELLKEGDRIKKAAALVRDPNAPRVASDLACKWCPAANVPGRPGGCEAHAKWVAAKIDMEFTDLDTCSLTGQPWEPPKVGAMTPERLIEISLAKSSIEKWLEFCHAQALQHLMDRGPINGFKAVEGRRPPRKWRDAGAAEAFMRQQLPSGDPFNPKIKTPGQAEKEIGKTYEIPAALVERGQPKPAMVPVGDARPAIRALEDEFEDQDDL